MENIYVLIEDNISEIIKLYSSFYLIINILTSSKYYSRLICNSRIISFSHHGNNIYHLTDFRHATNLILHGDKANDNMHNEIISLTDLRKLCVNILFEDYVLNLSSLIKLTNLEINVPFFIIPFVLTSLKKLKRCIKFNPSPKSRGAAYPNLESLCLKCVGFESTYQSIKLENTRLTKLKLINFDEQCYLEQYRKGIFLTLTKECSQNIIRMNLRKIHFNTSESFTSLVCLKLARISRYNDRRPINISAMTNLEKLILIEKCQHVYFENLNKLTCLFVGAYSHCEVVNRPQNLWNIEGKDNFGIGIKEHITSLTSLIINSNEIEWHD